MLIKMADYNPATLEEAIDILAGAVDGDERKAITAAKSMSIFHHGFGTHLRNTWGLWKQDSPLVKESIAKYGLGHADDISAIILHSVQAKLLGENPHVDALVKLFKKHWAKIGVDPVTGQKLN